MLQHTTVSEAQDIFLKSVMNLATMDTTTKDIKQRLSARAPSVGYACALLLHNGVNRLIQLHTPYGFRAMLSLLHTYVACSSYRYRIKQYLYFFFHYTQSLSTYLLTTYLEDFCFVGIEVGVGVFFLLVLKWVLVGYVFV